MDAQKLLDGNIKLFFRSGPPYDLCEKRSTRGDGINSSSKFAIRNEAAAQINQYELQSERANPLRFCEGCALAVFLSISCWALFFSIIHFLVVLVIYGR